MTNVTVVRARAVVTVVALLASLVAAAAVPSASAVESEPAPGPNIATFAGGSGQFNVPDGLLTGPGGSLYVASPNDDRVRLVTAPGVVTTVAGSGCATCPVGDGGRAVDANVRNPHRLALDRAGALYIAEDTRVRKVEPGTDGVVNGGDGETITTVAGGDADGDGVTVEGGRATDAFVLPEGVVLGAGNLYVADSRHRVYKVVPGPDGVVSGGEAETITTVAGNGAPAFAGDGGPAVTASINNPRDLALDGSALLIADQLNHRVRRVVPGADGVVNGAADEIITTVAGSTRCLPGDECNFFGGYGGDGGPATAAELDHPVSIAVHGGALYISDAGNRRVRRVDGAGIITTVAGDGTCCSGGDGGLATAAQFGSLGGLALDDVGNLFVADRDRIRVMGALSVATEDAPDPAPTGGLVNYTVAVGNFSAVPATGVRLTDALPAKVKFKSAIPSQGTCAQSKAVLTCALGNLPARSRATVRITVVAPTSLTTLTNTAGFTATHPDTIRVDDTSVEQTTVAAPAMYLSAAAASPDPGGVPPAPGDPPNAPKVGKPLTYTFRVANALNGAATRVTLTDPLPAQVSFRSATTSHGRCTEAAGTVACDLGTLAYADTATVAIEVMPMAPGVVTNTARFGAKEFRAGGTASVTRKVAAANCGRALTASTVLTEDVGPCLGQGIIVGADAITLDLGRKHVFGFPGPSPSTNQAGIRLPMRTGVTIRNGTVRDFDAGIVVNGGGFNTLGGANPDRSDGLRIRDNVSADDDPLNTTLGDGIFVLESPGNRIVNNEIVGNGIFDGMIIWGPRATDNLIENNLVADTVGPVSVPEFDRDENKTVIVECGPDMPVTTLVQAGAKYDCSFGQGIVVLNASEGSVLPGGVGQPIARTTIRANSIVGNASAGSTNVAHVDGIVEDNVVSENGRTHPNGNGIGVARGVNAATGENFRMLVQRNEIHRNRMNGIELLGASGNRILNNDAGDETDPERELPAWNAFDPATCSPTGTPGEKCSWDLVDRRLPLFDQTEQECVGNTWLGNTWGSGGYYPECVATGGNPSATPSALPELDAQPLFGPRRLPFILG